MKLSELFSGREDFASKRQILDLIRQSMNFDPKSESVQNADALLIFSTSKQHTWLVATYERLYCILDDLRKDQPHINWSINKAQLVAGNSVVANIRSRPRSDKSGLISDKSGLLDIDETHRHWLYTKRLFSDSRIEDRVRALI